MVGSVKELNWKTVTHVTASGESDLDLAVGPLKHRIENQTKEEETVSCRSKG